MKVTKHLAVSATLMMLATLASPAQAFIVLGDDAAQMLGLYDPEDQNADQNNNKPQAQQQSVSAGTSNGSLSLVNKQGLSPAPDVCAKSLKIIGYWVGNIQYKVGSDKDDRLYVIDPQNRVAALPQGTKADDIAIPMHNAYVDGMMSAQPVASGEAQLRRLSQKNGGGAAQYVTGDRPGLRPTFMATRTAIVGGKPMIIGGAVISELPPSQMPHFGTQKSSNSDSSEVANADNSANDTRSNLNAIRTTSTNSKRTTMRRVIKKQMSKKQATTRRRSQR